jgi:hypothetical protein
MSRLLLLASALLLLVRALPAEAASGYFACYRSKTIGGSEKFVRRPGVGFTDRFGARSANVFGVERLCTPATTAADPAPPSDADHLRGYLLRKVEPHPDRVHGLVIANELGTLTLDLLKLDRALVPTRASTSTPPSAPSPPAVDHFICYKTRESPGTSAFEPVEGVALADPLGTLLVDVEKPRKLCFPADKNGEAPGAENHPGLLLCYKLGPSAGAPRFDRVSPIFTADQFQELTVDARRPAELCVPSGIAP